MRATTVIGFDFGSYWIGVAVGQTLTRQATPLPALRNNDWKAIARLLDEWRKRARDAERDREDFKQRAEQASSTANRLQGENSRTEERVRELQDTVASLNRELAVMEKRTEHLRQHLRTNG